MPRVCLALAAACFLAAASPQQVTAWREDLHVMSAELAKTHRNLYHAIPQEQFSAMVAQLDAKIPSLTRAQTIVEMMKIVAAVGDGHTNINPARDPKIGFRTLPVALYFFEDGLYVRAARNDLAGLAGQRVIRIGKSSVDDAYARVKPLISRDNEQGVRYWAPFFLAMPEILEATGIADDAESVALTLEDGRVVTLHPAGPFEPMPSDTDTSWIRREGWTDARGTNDPLWLRDPNAETRLEMLPGTKTLYAQVNRIDAGLPRLADQLRARVTSGGVDRLVLDLRLNRGGHGEFNTPLVRAIIQSTAIDQPGRFFCLIGRGTYSAAQFLIDDLANYTNVTFVGEPSGSKGNHYGDSRKITLPNSGITVRASIYWWQHWAPWSHEEATVPTVSAPLTSAEYRAGVDPGLLKALGPKPKALGAGCWVLDPLRGRGEHPLVIPSAEEREESRT